MSCLRHHLHSRPIGPEQARNTFVPRIMEMKVIHARLHARPVERKPERVRCHWKYTHVRSRQTLQNFNRTRCEADDVVDDLLGTPAVLDATKKCRLTFKINISPCEPQEISA